MKGNRWIHYGFGGWVPMLKRNGNGETTICGKTAQRIIVTKHIPNVTCKKCLDEIDEKGE